MTVRMLSLAPLSRRARTLTTVAVCTLFFAIVFLAAWLYGEQGQVTDLAFRNLSPSLGRPCGTDWLGRDMLARCLKGIRISLAIGMTAAVFSAALALLLGLAAALLGRTVDRVVTWLVDVGLATPHLVLLILISFACGGGVRGVIIAVAASHWPALTRIIRAEVLQLRTSEYVQYSKRLGKGAFWIGRHHMLSHVIPQFLVGLLLLFPHAILHAAGLTFLGFGMSPHMADVGVLLAESMRYLSTGMWWLALVPGLFLIASVLAFDALGNQLRALLDPRTSRE